MSADCPFKHLAEGKLNMMNFQNMSRHKVCFNCGNIASRKWCAASKMTEYCRESETLTVYHIGVHACHLKKDTKLYRKQVREAEVWLLEVFNRLKWVRQLPMVTFGRHREETYDSYANVRSEKAKISKDKQLVY